MSEVDAAQVLRFSLSLGQPELFVLRDAMRADPTGPRWRRRSHLAKVRCMGGGGQRME